MRIRPFSMVYSNCCCSCWFESEIIKIGQSSHKMYSNNIVNSQESTTILNAHTKRIRKLIEVTTELVFVLFNVILESSYWCIHALFHASESCFFFFSWHKVQVISRMLNYVHCHQLSCPLVYLSGFLPSHLKNGLEYLTPTQIFIPLMRFLLQSLVLKCFLVLLM